MTRRFAAISLSTALVVSFLTAAPVAAVRSAPIPSSMAAVGDSITQAASTGGSLGADAPQNSWSTGTSTTVNSHYLRLLEAGAPISGKNHNLSVSGAKVDGLEAQMVNAAAVQPDYLTVLIGGNDLCTDTVDLMTDPGVFYTEFHQAMSTLHSRSPETHVYVVSIPDVYQLWKLFKNNFWARFIWSSADICQSLLANPTSTQTADVERRKAVRDQNIAYNAALADVCSLFTRCLFDGNAVFNYTFAASDVSGDYFHPSASGQANLARVTWNVGYTWTVGTPPPPTPADPVAGFDVSCLDLTCTFTDNSSDADGTIVSHAWDFGDGATSDVADPDPHTFASAGTYAVTLTVTDDGGATDSETQSVSVSEAPPPTIRIGDLSATQSKLSSTTWEATVTILVTTPAGTPVQNATVAGSWSVGATDTCTTNSNGTCTATSDVLSRSGTRTVTFTANDVEHSTHVYDPSANLETSITVRRP